MPKCDICHKYFKTKKQMKQHKTKEYTKKFSGTKFRIPQQNFDLCYFNHQHKMSGFSETYVFKEE